MKFSEVKTRRLCTWQKAKEKRKSSRLSSFFAKKNKQTSDLNHTLIEEILELRCYANEDCSPILRFSFKKQYHKGREKIEAADARSTLKLHSLKIVSESSVFNDPVRTVGDSRMKPCVKIVQHRNSFRIYFHYTRPQTAAKVLKYLTIKIFHEEKWSRFIDTETKSYYLKLVSNWLMLSQSEAKWKPWCLYIKRRGDKGIKTSNYAGFSTFFRMKPKRKVLPQQPKSIG